MPAMNISSTEIRRRIGAGESIAGLVPAEVAEYIGSKRLYR
jgi:nicotinic acid mononucleotide adenylyltransferase